MDHTKNDEITAMLNAGIESAKAESRMVDVEGVPVALIPRDFAAQTLKEALELADARAEAPRRRKGTVITHEVDSFIDIVNRFKDDDSVVFANASAVNLTAILDYHCAGGFDEAAPRWGEHRVVYACPLSRPWKEWAAFAASIHGQDDFGNFIEEHSEDITGGDGFPPPAAILEMARHMSVNVKATFERKVNVTTGETTLVAKDEHDETTSTKIPKAFRLKLQVFEGGVFYAVEARLRLSWQDGRPRFALVLHRIEDVKRDAFGEVRKIVSEKTALPVFAGVEE